MGISRKMHRLMMRVDLAGAFARAFQETRERRGDPAPSVTFTGEVELQALHNAIIKKIWSLEHVCIPRTDPRRVQLEEFLERIKEARP